MEYPTTLTARVSGRADRKSLGAAWIVALGAIALASTGCMARAGVRGAVVYEAPSVEVETVPVAVEAVPVEVEAYPSYVYAGTNVYLVDGRWYRRHSGHWVVYRAEPRALASVRVSYEGRYGRGYRPAHKAAPPRKDHKGNNGHHDRR